MSNINELFVPYTESIKLKELGFDEDCLAYWNLYTSELNFNGTPSKFSSEDVIGLPTFSQSFKFFREKYPQLDFGVAKIHNETNNYHYHINLTWEFFEGTYEEAELECLRKLIEISKNFI